VLMGSKTYTTTIDIWSIGCIFVEMILLKPLFPGQSEENQLDKIFEKIGTPDPKTWKELKDLEVWKAQKFKSYKRVPWEKIVPTLDKDGIDLLSQMLKPNPKERIHGE